MQNICITSGEGAIALFRIFKNFQTKLTWYLVGSVMLSGMVALLSGYLVIRFGLGYVENHYDDPQTNRSFQKKYMDDLRQYVSENDIALENIDDLQEWIEENDYVYMSVYQNNKVIFNSDYAYYDSDVDLVEIEEENTILMDEKNLYSLELADGSSASVDMFCYDYWRYNYYVWAMGVGGGILIFIWLLTRMLQKKLQYINEIENELHILEGGNLEYPITVRGKDELAGLAKGIDQMRLSIMENMQKEQEMLQANKDLVTSMSHDLRTPLTTLTGYLEILSMNPVKDEEKRRHYLELSLAKTREIKVLSDELFEYFLAYGENKKEIAVEGISALELVSDFFENQFLCLEEEGYTIQYESRLEPNVGNCLINGPYMQRVLNNIISNLGKYAEKEEPIRILAQVVEDQLQLSVENTIARDMVPHESTKIGLITCERIMNLHKGAFIKRKTDDTFCVTLCIPMES